MENNLKFNSAICTSIEQSERLLSLGLKKETADMHHSYYTRVLFSGEKSHFWKEETGYSEKAIPAWSLHRLIEMCDINPFIFYTNCGYDNVVDRIETLIKEGDFDKEYLKEENS